MPRSTWVVTEYHQAYLPDVPLKLLCQMTLGKDAPDTWKERRAVCQRIMRESEIRTTTRPYLLTQHPDPEQVARDLLR